MTPEAQGLRDPESHHVRRDAIAKALLALARKQETLR